MLDLKSISLEQARQAIELLIEYYDDKLDASTCECAGTKAGCWYCRVKELVEETF